MPFSPVGHIYKRLSSCLHKRGCASFNARDLSLTFMAATRPYSAENGTEMAFSWFLWPPVSLFSKKIVVIVCIYHRPLLGAASTAEVGVMGPVSLSQEITLYVSWFLGTRGSGRCPCCLYAVLIAHSFQHHLNFVALVVSHYSLYIYI